jgi:hypothetical protein
LKFWDHHVFRIVEIFSRFHVNPIQDSLEMNRKRLYLHHFDRLTFHGRVAGRGLSRVRPVQRDAGRVAEAPTSLTRLNENYQLYISQAAADLAKAQR